MTMLQPIPRTQKGKRMYEIEDGIEVPVISRAKYPWREMAVGQSFFVKNRSGDGRRTHQHMCSVAWAAKKRLGMKFSTRRVEGGVRVWRLE